MWWIIGFCMIVGVILILALCKVAGEADERIEEMMRRERGENNT